MSGGKDYTLDPDTALMVRFVAGDTVAFERIVENFQRQVFGLIYRYLGQSSQAEDCAQEVFLRLYRMRGSYRPSARLSTLVYRITSNLCLNYIRDEKKRRMISLDRPLGESDVPIGSLVADDSQDAATLMEAGERAAIVQEALGEIPPRQRMALLLHRFEGLSYADVAATMEINVSAVKSLLNRARTSLAEALERDIDAGNL